jgi:hypothetical protein
MGRLFEKIREHVKEGRYVVGAHASERLDERGILEWQVIDGVDAAKLLQERTDAEPNPVVELEQLLADGTPVKVVWSLLKPLDIVKLVTVHYLD